MFKRFLAIVVIAALLVAGLYYSKIRHRPLQISGFIEADEIRLGSRVGGRVAEVDCEEGQRVEAGQLLIRLEEFDLDERRGGRRQPAGPAGRARAPAEWLSRGRKAQAKARVDRLAAVVAKMRAGPLDGRSARPKRAWRSPTLNRNAEEQIRSSGRSVSSGSRLGEPRGH